MVLVVTDLIVVLFIKIENCVRNDENLPAGIIIKIYKVLIRSFFLFCVQAI